MTANARRFQRSKMPEPARIPCITKDCPRQADARRQDKRCENCGFFFDHGRKKANP